MRFKAFSLAEVLIALVIICVISAVTIPIINVQLERKEMLSRLKKVYSVLGQAAIRAQHDNGPFNSWVLKDDNLQSIKQVSSYFLPYMNVLRTCENKAGCWAETTKSLSGQKAKWTEKNKIGVHYYGLTLMDGTNVSIDLCSPMYAEFGLPENIERPFIIFYVDVNGDRNPNAMGRDIFGFAMDSRGVIPFGVANDSAYCTKSRNNNSAGYDCAYKFLRTTK